MSITTLDRIDSGVRDIFRPRVSLSLYDFAVKNLMIVEGPGSAREPVRWNPNTFPPQKTVIEAMGDTRWASVTLLTGPQTFGKTQVMTALLMYGIAELRVSVAYVSSTLNLAGTQWGKKFRPGFEAVPALNALIPESADQAGKKEERKFANSTSMHFAGSDSIGALSGFTAPKIVIDDIQAYSVTVGGLGHPADVAQTRAKSFPREQRSIVKAGTAGMITDYLAVSLLRSACFLPFVPCLGCSAYQLIEFERFVYDDSSVIEAATNCFMRCANPECDHQIRFEELARMLERMQWVSMPPGVDWISAPACESGTMVDIATADVYPNTSRATDSCGFWASSLYWPLGETWGQVAAAYVSIDGNPDGLKDFNQHNLSRPQREPTLDEEKLTAEQVHALAVTGHRFGTIPFDMRETLKLTTCIDVQAGYLYVTVHAWNKQTGSSALVFARTVGEKKRLPADSRERDREQHQRIMQALDDVYAIDAGGWPIVDTDGKEVCRCHSDIFLVDAGYFPDTIHAYVGARGGMGGKWRATRGSRLSAKDPKGEIWPKMPVKSRVGNRRWYEPHVNRSKLMLREILTIPPGQPGAWAIASDTPKNTMRTYAAHMASEEYDRLKDRWVKVAANHYLDCETLQISAAVAVGVRIPMLGGASPAVVKPINLREWMARLKRNRGGA